MASDTLPATDRNGKAREKVALKPGFHLADWQKLVQVSSDMSGRNGGPMRKVSLSELGEHASQFDCWTAYKGKVYNISNYIAYHPGGKKIMQGAGKDCTVQFDKYHAWVNCASMLSKCQVGILMSEHKAISEEEEEGEQEREDATSHDDSSIAASALTTITACTTDTASDERVDITAKALANLNMVDDDEGAPC